MTSEDAKKALVKLFQCYNLSGSEVERKLKFNSYWEILGLLPADRAVDACLKAAKGQIGNPGFLPTAAELYQAAFKSAQRGYPRLIEPVSNISEEEKARVVQGFKELRAKLKQTSGEAKIAEWKRPAEWLHRSLGKTMQAKLEHDKLMRGRG